MMRNFRDAKCFVEEFLGFGLTNIESIDLRRIVMHVTGIDRNDAEKYYKGGIDKQTIHPDKESAFIFLNRNYGTQMNRADEGVYEK